MAPNQRIEGFAGFNQAVFQRLAHPQKHDVFVLDFMNDTDTIQQAFADYYRTTVLSDETDPNKLHGLKAFLDGYQVYSESRIDKMVELYLGGAAREKLSIFLNFLVAKLPAPREEDLSRGILEAINWKL